MSEVWTTSEHGVPITITQKDDPAFALLLDGHVTTPVVHRDDCFICEDPEFARMGLPLCRPCPRCGGHVAADDSVCDDCDLDELDWHFGFVRDLAACTETNS